MRTSESRLGTLAWILATGGQLQPSDHVHLIGHIFADHAMNGTGRLAMLTRTNSGRRVKARESDLAVPSSDLTRSAQLEAERELSPVFLNHSYRSYFFGLAVGELVHIDVDRELLFGSAMLHTLGLHLPKKDVDFTSEGAARALSVAEKVGLSTTATNIMRNAITLHTNPGKSLAVHGSVAYLLSAGSAMDRTGMGSWKLRPDRLDQVLDKYPRLAFKAEFSAATASEAKLVPHGRIRVLRRYGFDLALRSAPYSS